MRTSAIILLALFATELHAEETFRLHTADGEVFLLNTATGETHLLDREALKWETISTPTSPDNEPTHQDSRGTTLTLREVEFDRLIDPIGQRITLPAKITNRAETSKRYSVAVTVPSHAAFRSLRVWHHTIDGSMSSESLPAPESAFQKNTVYFDVLAEPFERLDVSLTMANALWNGDAHWRVRSDSGENLEESVTVSNTLARPLETENPSNDT